jgi:hypothetical protein
MNDHETNWDVLSIAWRSLAVPAESDARALSAYIDAQTRRGRVWRALELALTAAALGIGWIVLEQSPGRMGRILAGDVLAMLIIAWVFTLLSRRAHAGPASAATEVYLRVARLRVRQRLGVVWLALALLAAQWVLAIELRRAGSGFSIVCSVLWIAWAVWEHRRLRRERRWLDTFDGNATK